MGKPFTSSKPVAAWARATLGVFLAAWLSLALQSCAMAASPEPECPHCPPSETQEAPPCETTDVPDCDFDDELTADARGTQLQIKGEPGKLQLPCIPESAAHALRGQALPAQARSTLVPDHGGPPPHVLNCVYLK